jgi:Domain of unknown function (DUF5615)
VTAFYADEHFPGPAVDRLRALGHDVLTAREDGRADQGIGDPFVLVRATALGRAVLTHNRRDFRRLHRRSAAHAGIVACTRNDDFDDLADRTDCSHQIEMTTS